MTADGSSTVAAPPFLGVRSVALQARQAARAMAGLGPEAREAGLAAMRAHLLEARATIEAANREIERDLENSDTRWFVDSMAIEPTLADDKYYLADRHHLNDAGHALLGKVLGPIVVKIARAAHRSSRFW